MLNERRVQVSSCPGVQGRGLVCSPNLQLCIAAIASRLTSLRRLCMWRDAEAVITRFASICAMRPVCAMPAVHCQLDLATGVARSGAGQASALSGSSSVSLC